MLRIGRYWPTCFLLRHMPPPSCRYSNYIPVATGSQEAVKILFGAPQRGREREDGENASPASLKRVTHSDTFRFAAKYPVGAAAGFASWQATPQKKPGVLCSHSGFFVRFHRYWFAAIGKVALPCSTFTGSFFGKLLTGTNTPFEISSARRAFFFASISAFFAALILSS